MVSSARTKIAGWDVQMPISKSVVGIFYSPLQSRVIADFKHFLWPTIGHILHHTSPDLDKVRG